jgi:hypothetical protein
MMMKENQESDLISRTCLDIGKARKQKNYELVHLLQTTPSSNSP